MKNKKVFGLAVLALILVIVGATNYILSALSARVDLTAERLYTLSPGSKAVLAKLDQKVTLKFFFSESAKDMPPSLKTYAEQVRDLLGEYERAGNGNVVIETYDPKQDSDEEEWAVKYGVEPQQANPFGAPIYFGLVVTCGTQEQTIPGFDPRMESTLENEITRHITRVAWPERPVVGVLSAIPGVLGEQMNPMMMQMRRRPSPGWVAFSELKKDYDLREIAKDAESIDPDVKALVVIHPKDLSEKTLFAIDQFVIKGGRLIACVDPFSFKDFEASSQQQQNPMMQMGGQGGPSTLGKLFEKWGISFDTIAGYGYHGAIVHYEATEETDAALQAKGFLLLDSGGQYLDGTTDITRTIALGPLTEEERRVYTLVLKGHIRLQMLKFPDGACGSQLDAVARSPLWKEGLNFLHGTGHGVGAYLNVHEGPHQVRMEWKPAPLHAGMTLTDEPGIYVEGKFGVRIENTILITPYKTTDFGKFLQFETLTLCPIDLKPVVASLLSEEEKEWLNQYHLMVRRRLSPLLDEEHRLWLEKATSFIED